MAASSTEGSLQGFHIPDTEELINMEPCTLWAKFLLKSAKKLLFLGLDPGLHGAAARALAAKEPYSRCLIQARQ